MNKTVSVFSTLALLMTTATASFAHTTRRPADRSADQLNEQVLQYLRSANTSSTAVEPVVATTVTSPVSTPVVETLPPRNVLSGVYVGVNSGGNFRSRGEYQLGAVLGYQATPYLGAELTYDFAQRTDRTNGQLLIANGVVSVPTSTQVTPYALVGVGTGWNSFGAQRSHSTLGVYNVGAGVRVNLNAGVELDARYRYVGSFNANNGFPQHVLTGGFNYRF